MRASSALLAGALLALAGCQFGGTSDASGTAEDWPAYGGTSDETHFSTLDQINDGNIDRLGLAWSVDLPPMMSSVGAPLAIDGTLYLGVGLTQLYAFDARTGAEKWYYDAEVAKVAGHKLRMGWGIRGIAYAAGRLFAGTQDGRLIAVDARSGKLVWSVETTERGDGRYITGAPRVFNDKVIIGNGGADFTSNRGYVTAYDQASGRQAWRFFIVPGDPAKGFENRAMAMAAKTWTGEWWKWGGGGNAWNAITYDAKYNRILIGTGNGSPWNHRIRSPQGGDNLFLCSVVALDADTGEYAWHYQINPGETWDYNAAMDIELAGLEIGGKQRDVAMIAPKNGFFYVIDRRDGKLISAEPFTEQNWAERIDIATGRPVERPEARFSKGFHDLRPSSMGGHNWHAMSFSPKTGLVYIPTLHLARRYDARGIDPAKWRRPDPPIFDNGIRVSADIDPPPPPPTSGTIQAWDPVRQKRVWSQDLKGAVNGGVASTAGNLLFQGLADGRFTARASDTGKLLWSFDAHNGILAQPITYSVGGRQFVTVVTGFGGTAAVQGPSAAQFGWDYRTQRRRVLTFALDGKARLPAGEKPEPAVSLAAPDFEVDAAKAKRGFEVFARRCISCHGFAAVAGGQAPDLRASAVPLDADLFRRIVRDGELQPLGMPHYQELTDADLEALRHYIRRRANEALAPPRAPSPRSVDSQMAAGN